MAALAVLGMLEPASMALPAVDNGGLLGSAKAQGIGLQAGIEGTGVLVSPMLAALLVFCVVCAFFQGTLRECVGLLMLSRTPQLSIAAVI